VLIAARLAIALLLPAICSTSDGATVWIEDVDCGGYWEVCRTGEFDPGAKLRACCLLAFPELCRLAFDGAGCLAVELHRCDG
jgi:hypothetical protein